MEDIPTSDGKPARPEVTVVVPVHDVAPYLRDCLDSVLHQTTTGWDCVCVDDGSTDGSGAICDEYAAADPRFHVVHQKNRGLSAARNAGIDWAEARSSSRYVTFVDSDDWIEPCFLDELRRAADAGDGVAATPLRKTDEDSRFQADSDPSPAWRTVTVDRIWTGRSIIGSTACGKIFRKSLLTGIRFPVGKFHEDEWTTHRILFRASRGGLTETPLYVYRQRAGSITHRPWTAKRLRDAQEALAAQIVFFEKAGKTELAASRRDSLIRLSCSSLQEMERSGTDIGRARCRRMLRFCLRRIPGRNRLPLNHPAYLGAHPVRVRIRKAFPRLDGFFCKLLRARRAHA